MKRKLKALSTSRRHSLYQEVARLPLTVTEKDLTLYIQHSRLDARLAEVVTEHIRDFWWKHDPTALNKRLKRQPWPHAVIPMLLHIFELCAADRPTRLSFTRWMELVLQGIGRTENELYFITNTRPRSAFQNRHVNESLPVFSKAGYFSKDLLFNKGRPGTIKSSAADSPTVIDSEAALKLEILAKLRPALQGQTLHSLGFKTGMDRTTLSKIRSGNVEGISIKRLLRCQRLF